METIETDYLVIGAGTAGMAFADTLLDETDATITIVDRHGKPGGHWNDAYPFVTLHQPSAFYGVNSMPLGSGLKDKTGLNQGLFELASGAEICGYFDRVMHQRLLPSGRVRYLPMSRTVGDPAQPEIESLLSGTRTKVSVRRKIVDGAYGGPVVPSTHRRKFAVAPGVHVVPPNALPQLGLADAASDGEAGKRPSRFVILGAGKTAMDAAIWLIGAGASPDAIRWVVPRDSWLINRITVQPSEEFFEETIGGMARQMQALAEARSTEDLFLRLEACGMLLRIDPTRTPTMFHLANVSAAEVEVLRRIRDVVRLGRVTALESGHMQLEHGRVETEPGSLFIDCTASAVEPRPVQPVFQGGRIVLQIVRLPQPAFSAALTAYVEAHYEGDEEKNRLCGTVPFPYTLDDYPLSMGMSLRNQFQWAQDKVLRQWIRESRLDGFGKLLGSVAKDDVERQAVLLRLKEQTIAAAGNIARLSVGR